MAKGGKARTIIVRMISTAQTGFFYTTKRVRLNSPKLSAVKYDPVVYTLFRANETLLSETTAALHRNRVMPWQMKRRGEPILMEPHSYMLQLNRTQLLFIPSLYPTRDPNSTLGTVVQVCVRGDHGDGDVLDMFAAEQASVTMTIETLLAGHVNVVHKLHKRVIVKDVFPRYTLIGVRKPWKYGREKKFCLGDSLLQPAKDKWMFRFEKAE